jgi:TonB-linked SusC/RagA family outer membrane protein
MQFSFAQEKTVTGVVSDKTGPLPGANVVVKGTTRSAQADSDGKYSIKTKTGEVLVFSFTGYINSTVTVGAGNAYNVKLSEGIVLEDVVVLGYDRKSTKPKSIAASTTVTSDSFENRPNVTLLQSLQGAAPGLTVSTSSGTPGSAKIDLLLRGIGTLSADTQPLYVIDGIATNSAVFRNINPEDIESATILRDAAGTSIYGNRGANGVLVIKTKSGKYESGLKMSYSTSTGFSTLPKNKYHLANAQQALTIERAAQYGIGNGDATELFPDNAGVPLTDAQIASYQTTDWTKEFFGTGVTTTHNISMAIGGKNISNFTSLSYMNQEGIVPTTDFQRFTLRSNLTGKSKDERFTYGTSLTIGYSKRHQLSQESNAGVNNNTVQNPLLGSLTALPYMSPSMYAGSGQALYDQIGTTFNHGNDTFVLYDILQEGNIPNRYKEIKLLGNFNAAYELTKEWSVGTKFGVDYNVSDRNFARAPWSYLAIAVRESQAVPYGGFESITTDRDFGFNIVNSLNYNKTFKEKHTFTGGLYMEYLKSQRNFDTQTQNGLDLKTYAFGAGTGWTNVGATYDVLRPTGSAAKFDAGSFSYFGTLGYDYDSKYALDVLVRRDASYRFVQDNKWGTFWSIGGRWNIDKEDFMKNSTFSLLKLRASYGTQGNQNIIAVAAGSNPLYSGNNLVRDLTDTSGGYGNTGGYDVANIANKDLQWEQQTMTNFGLDFELMNTRLSGTVDFYNRQTDKLFNFINISATPGFGSSINGNAGGINNKGVELSLRYKIIKDAKDLKLSVFANGSYNKNEITDLEQTISGNRIYENGSMVGELYEVPYMGINPANGNLLFLDINDNLTESPDDNDRRKTGKSDTPSFQGAFGFNAEYKGFFLDSQFTWVADVYRYDTALFWLYNPSYVGDNNVSADLLNSWTPTNTNTNIASLNATNYDSGVNFSDEFLKDASYVRLKNVSIGYSFSKDLLKGTFISALKLYAQGENLYTWTRWRGFDPESTDETNLGKFPSPKTISFGVNVEF